MAAKTNEDAIRSTLGSQTNDKTVMGQAVYKVLNSVASPDDKISLLAICLVELQSVERNSKDLPNKGLTNEEWDQLTKTHAPLLDAHLKMSFFKSQSANDFSKEILRLVEFMSTENEKTFVISYALYSDYIPYRQLPGTPTHMSNEDYKHKLRAGKDRFELIQYIIALPFDEFTERASMLLQVIDDTTDRSLRVALLASAWQKIEEKTVRKTISTLQSK